MTKDIREIAFEIVENCGSPYPETHAKEVEEKIKSFAKRQSILFAEWCAEEGWDKHVRSNTWHNRMGYSTEYTTEELYNLFLEQCQNT